MANKSTMRNRPARDGYKAKTGRAINSTLARAATGRKPYKAPTLKEHPIKAPAMPLADRAPVTVEGGE